MEHLLAANESIHLSPAQAEKIFRETRGMPGLIKRRAAELTDSQETKRITFDVMEYLPIRTAIGGGIALLVVLLGLVYQDSINSMFTSNDEAPEVGQDALVAAGRTQPLALPSLTDESVSVLEEAGVEGARLSAPHSMGAAVVDPGGEQPVESMPVAGLDQAPLAAEPDVGEHQAQEEGSAAPVEESDPAKTETESTAETVVAPELAEVPEPEPVEQKEMESSGTELEQAVTTGQEDGAAAEVAVPPSVQSGPASIATSAVAKLEPKIELPEVDADKADVVPEPPKIKVPNVRPQAEPVTPKVKKPAVPIKTDTKPVRPK
ncbi:MAG: hypothetical protein GY809_22380, partial [Planctomycetes bacterium]|nr:hypothetical protein [Planctomycetota bacterium]